MREHRTVDLDAHLPALREVIARAADPHERATADWCRPVATPDEVRASRRTRWVAAVSNGDPVGFSELLRRRGIDDATFERMLADVEVHVSMPEPPFDESADHTRLPAWARALLELVTGAHAPVEIPPISVGELVSDGEATAPDVDPGDPWTLHAAIEPLLAAPSRHIETLASRGVPVTLGAQRRLLVAAARRFAEVSVHTLAAPPAAFGDGTEALDLLDMSLLEIFLTDEPDVAGWMAVFEFAPTLGRVLGTTYAHWSTATAELFDRLAADADQLRVDFAGGDPLGALCDIETDSGDLHRGGRAVQVLRFEQGTSVVYKPKNLAVGVAFLDLLTTLSADTSLGSLEPRLVLARGDYTWEAFVDRAPCEPDGVARFYRRYGMIARLVQALRGHDISCENLLAHGEHPEVIDLESLFRPVSKRADDMLPLDRELIERWLSSVAGTSMITAPIVADAGRMAADMSPLSPASEWSAPFRQARLARREDGAMRVVWEYTPTPRATAVPLVYGATIDPADHLDAVLAGYEEVHALLISAGDWLTSALPRFASTPVRFLNRNSHIYARLIRASLQPHCMRDGIAREISIDRLWKAVRKDPYGGIFIGDEVDAVRQLDIPLIQSLPGSTDAILNDGSIVVDAFARPALDDVAARVADEDAVAAARTALGCVDIRARPVGRIGWVPERSPSDWIAGAVEIGRLVADVSVRCGQDVGWLGVGYSPLSDAWNLQPLGTDLLNGSGGVAVALAEIAAASGDDIVATAAFDSLQSLCHRLHRVLDEAVLQGGSRVVNAPSNPPLVGGLLGFGSLLQATAAAAAAIDDRAAVDAVVSALHRIDPVALVAHACDDALGGRSGLAGNLRAVARIVGDDHADALASAVEWTIDPDAPRPGPYPEGAWAFANLIIDPVSRPAVDAARATDTNARANDVMADLLEADEAAIGRARSYLDTEPQALTTRGLLDVLDVATMVRWSTRRSVAEPTPGGDDMGTAFADLILARRDATGSWFPDLRFSDRHHLSATYGATALARALLSTAGVPTGPPMRVAPLV